MSNIRYLTIMFLFAFAAAPAVAVEFPAEHPNDLKKAKSKGLQQLTAEELKAFIPGTIEAMRRDKKVKLKIFKPDGVFVVQSFNTKTGTWRLDTSTSTWCRSIYKKKAGGLFEQCYATFKAADGVHYFDFDIADNFYRSTWRPKSK